MTEKTFKPRYKDEKKIVFLLEFAMVVGIAIMGFFNNSHGLREGLVALFLFAIGCIDGKFKKLRSVVVEENIELRFYIYKTMRLPLGSTVFLGKDTMKTEGFEFSFSEIDNKDDLLKLLDMCSARGLVRVRQVEPNRKLSPRMRALGIAHLAILLINIAAFIFYIYFYDRVSFHIAGTVEEYILAAALFIALAALASLVKKRLSRIESEDVEGNS